MPILVQLDDFSVDEFAALADGYGSENYSYVVTPNVDHIIRLHDDLEFRSLYADASFVLLDSRFLSHVLRVIGGPHVQVCPGSDLTAVLFSKVMRPDDVVVLIGSSTQQANQLRERFGLRQLRHFNPSMGFIDDRLATEECLQFVESNSPYRFCFIAVGTPQGEMVAQQLKKRGHAKGLTLCIGASINFLTGAERRAPHWMQSLGFEWLFRLVRSPRRLGHRYLIRGPRLFRLLSRLAFVVRGRGGSRGYASAPPAARPEAASAASSSLD